MLSESKIVDLFTEVSLIDAYLNTLPMDSGRKVMPVLYNNLFNQFNIDSNQFKQNIEYYYGNPVLTEEIYDKVNERLTVYDEKLRVEDSIHNAFVQDSVRRMANLQQIHNERINRVLYYTKDTTEFKYRDNGLSFLGRIRLDLKAYGIQTPVVQLTPQKQEVYENALVDSIAHNLVDSMGVKIDSIPILLPLTLDSTFKVDIFHPIPWNLPKREKEE